MAPKSGKAKYECPIVGCPFILEYIEIGVYILNTIKHHDRSRHGLKSLTDWEEWPR